MGKLEHIISEWTKKETLDSILCVVEFDFTGNIKHIISEVNNMESKVRFMCLKLWFYVQIDKHIISETIKTELMLNKVRYYESSNDT